MDVQMTWNLEDLFPSEKVWNAKLEEAKALFDQLAAQKGHAAASAADLLRTARLYEESGILFDQLAVYAYCGFHQDMAVEEAKNRMELISNIAASAGEKISYLAPELMQYSMEDFNAYCKEQPELELYHHFAVDFFEKKAHVLDPGAEEILARMGDLKGS